MRFKTKLDFKRDLLKSTGVRIKEQEEKILVLQNSLWVERNNVVVTVVHCEWWEFTARAAEIKVWEIMPGVQEGRAQFCQVEKSQTGQTH